MEFVERVKSMTREQIARTMIDLLTHVSPDTFLKLATLSMKLTEGEAASDAIHAVRESLLEGENGQATRMFRRVMTELSPHCLKKVAQALFINGLLRSSTIRSNFAEEYGFYPPFTLLISPTMQCNLKCVGCYAGKYAQEKGLPNELIDRILTEARSMGCLFIVFSGGEPLTRANDLFRLIEKYDDMYFMFYTNGTLITDRVADELYRLGSAGAVISMEGFEDATDARRGKGVYSRIMGAMDRLKERGVPFGTSLTITSKNVVNITSDAFFEHLYLKGVMLTWIFLFMPVGKDADVSLMPTPQQREYLRHRDIALRAKYPIFIADFWNDAPYVGGCIAAGRNYIHINANGDVEPCVFTHVAVDSIYQKSVREALESDFFRFIRSKQPYSENMLTPCMIIDNPDVFRHVVKTCGAHPTHEGAEDVFTRFKDDLDDYGRQVRALFDPIWEKERTVYGYPTRAPGSTQPSQARTQP